MHTLLLALLAVTSFETVGSTDTSPTAHGAYYHATAAGTVEYLNFSVETAGTGFFSYQVAEVLTGTVVCSSGALTINCGAPLEGSTSCSAPLTAGTNYQISSSGCSGGDIYVGMQVSHTGTAYETFDSHISSGSPHGAAYKALDAATVERLSYMTDSTLTSGTATLSLVDLSSSTTLCTASASCNKLSRSSQGSAACSATLTAGHTYEIQRSGCMEDVYAGVQLSRPTTSTVHDTAGALLTLGSADGAYYQKPSASFLEDITYSVVAPGTGTFTLSVYDWTTFTTLCTTTATSCASTGIGVHTCAVGVNAGHLLEVKKSGCTNAEIYGGMRFNY